MPQPLYSNAGFLQPIEIRKNADFEVQLELTTPAETPDQEDDPFDLTGCLVRARLKKTGTDHVWNFVGSITAPATDGVARLKLGAAATGDANMALSPTGVLRDPDYTWAADVVLPDGTVVPYCYGPARVVGGVY